jgi:hypothetical protein
MRTLKFAFSILILIIALGGCGSTTNPTASANTADEQILSADANNPTPATTAPTCASVADEFNALAAKGRACQTRSDCYYAPAGNNEYMISSIVVGTDANVNVLVNLLDQYLVLSCIPMPGVQCDAIMEPACENNQCIGGGCGIIYDLEQ